MPAVSWAHDFHRVGATLHLPPGFRLFHASGVDDVPGTWVRHWSLLELFLALIIALTVLRLHGPRFGALALLTLTLTLPEDGVPKWSWLAILAGEALVRALPDGKLRRASALFRFASLLGVALIALPFAIEHVREGVFPALAQPDSTLGDDEVQTRGSRWQANVEGGMGARAKGVQRSPAAPAPAAGERPLWKS